MAAMNIKINELIKYCSLNDYIIIYDKDMSIIAQGTRLDHFVMNEKKKRYSVSYYRKPINGKDSIIAYRI